jgi:anti-anti-sigma regulatory factor
MMFKVTKERADNELILHLDGILDGSIDFNEIVGHVPGLLTMDCRKVVHMNSALVGPWLQYFSALQKKGQNFRFRGCTDPLIQYFNLVPGFTCGGKVESAIAPFFCFKCTQDFQLEIVTRSLEEAILATQSKLCPTCQGSLSFDDDEKTFFKFMSHGNATLRQS